MHGQRACDPRHRVYFCSRAVYQLQCLMDTLFRLWFGKISAQLHTIVKQYWKCIVFVIVFSIQELNA